MLCRGSSGSTEDMRGFTVTLQALTNEAPQHLTAVVAEGGSAVGVDHQAVRADPDLRHRRRPLGRSETVNIGYKVLG